MSPHKILIVDDAAETRLFLKSLVISLGFASFEAKNGLEALKMLDEHKMDLILLDILMPNMDGYQLLEKINELRENRDFRVAFITGIRGTLDQEKLNILKPDEIIHKTVDVNVLKNKIKKLMSFDIKNKREGESLLQRKEDETDRNIPLPSFQGDSEFTATITNMPIVIDVKATKTSPTSFIFIGPVQFKTGINISFLSDEGSRQLNREGEIQTLVKKCVAFGDKFAVEVDLLPDT